MAESDAEWFQPSGVPVNRRTKPRPIPPPTTVPPRRRRPGTATPRRRRPLSPTPFIPPAYTPPSYNPGRRRRPTIRPPHRRHHPHDEADTAATRTLSSGAVAAISVVSSLVVVAAILALLYFVVFRKKFTKKAETLKNDYSTRVEDVIHVTFDDSSNTYANTQDLQKLVQSIRNKPKQPIPHVNNAFQSTPFLGSRPGAKPSAPPMAVDAVNDEPAAKELWRPEQAVTSPARPAPPPPKAKPVKQDANSGSFGRALSTELFGKTPGQMASRDTKQLKSMPFPPILPKPKLKAKVEGANVTKEAKPLVPIKPRVLPAELKNKNTLINPFLKETSNVTRTDRETSPKISGILSKQDLQAKPELLSLTQKKAMWEAGSAKR